MRQLRRKFSRPTGNNRLCPTYAFICSLTRLGTSSYNVERLSQSCARGSCRMARQTRIRKGCASCGAELPRSNMVFCSNICQAEYRYNQYIERWQAGIETGNKQIGHISNHIRRFLIRKYDEKCSQCGWDTRNPATGKVPVTVDHIDGNWQNNSESNLRLLCPNCHSLTPTYQGLNRGSGRPWRYKKVRNSEDFA